MGLETTAEARERGGNVKAVLFSNFPLDVFQNTLKPKFDAEGIEILRVVSADKGLGQRCDDADVVIAMIELMSNGQRDRVKALAKKAGKPFVALYRKGAMWEKNLMRVKEKFSDKKPTLSLVTPHSKGPLPNPVLPSTFFLDEEPPTSIEPPPEYAKEELEELLNLALGEVEKLSLEHAARKDHVEEQRSLIEKLKLERNQMAAVVRQKEELNQTLETAIAKVKNDRADLQKEFDQWKSSKFKADNGSAMMEHRRDIEALTGQIKHLKEQLERSDDSLKLAHDEISVNIRKANQADFLKKNNALKDDRIKELEAKVAEMAKFVDSAKMEVQKFSDETARAQESEKALKKELQEQKTIATNASNTSQLLQETRGREDAANKELNTLKAKHKNLEEEVARLKVQKPLPLSPPSVRATKKTEDFVEVRNAFKQLWRVGAMDGKEILEKLMNWEPKEES